MPITATVIAVRVAIGLIACKFVLIVVMNDTRVTSETKINAAPMIEFLCFIFWSLMLVISLFDLMLSSGTGCSRIRTDLYLSKMKQN